MSLNRLSTKELEQFAKIKYSLYIYANKKLNILKYKDDWKDVMKNDPEEIIKLRDYIFEEDIDLIDEYKNENPNQLNQEDLEILLTWKNAIVANQAILFKYTKEKTLIFVEDNVYSLIGFKRSFRKRFKNKLPLFISLIILPFKDKLIHEGFFLFHEIPFKEKVKDELVEEIEDVMDKKGVISRLDKN